MSIDTVLDEWRARKALLMCRYPVGVDPLHEWGAPAALLPITTQPNRTCVRPPDLLGPAVIYTDSRLRKLGLALTGLELEHFLEFLNDYAELRIGRVLLELCDSPEDGEAGDISLRDQADPMLSRGLLDARDAVLDQLDGEISDAAPFIMYYAWRQPSRGFGPGGRSVTAAG